MQCFSLRPVAQVAALLVAGGLMNHTAQAQTVSEPVPEVSLPEVRVSASADASAQGLSPAYAGGQVARGGRVGLLGTLDHLDSPFSVTAYTNELIQAQQARSVGDVLQNDPSVRVARGYGNFQESYFIRGFVLSSDDVAYNGLYQLLPRQYIATELFERVELLRGASAFLIGANPGGGGIGGAINLLPKRAPNEDLNRVNVALDANGRQATVSADIARRFGADQNTGLRVNAATRDGGTGVDDESVHLDLVSVGLDWRNRDTRLSADVGFQEHRLRRTRTNVTLTSATVPEAPDGTHNWAQPWSYSNERDAFGSLRGEHDFSSAVTGWFAYGARRSQEANSLANLTVSNASTGAGTVSRFDNAREDHVDTGELGLRGTVQAGPVKHEWVAAYNAFELKVHNAYAMSGSRSTNLYQPVDVALPDYTYLGNDLANPAYNRGTSLHSLSLGDTLKLFDDRLALTVGVREQRIQTESVSYATYNVTSGVSTAGGVLTSYDKRHTSPAYAALWHLNKQLSVYGNVMESLAQGDTASGTPVYANQGEQLAPYVSRQKEVGLKYDGGRLGGTLALFSTTKPRAVRTAANLFAAEGEDRHQGIELSWFGQAWRGLKVLGGVTWLDAQQRDTGSATTDGKRVIGVARLQANLGAEWAVPGVAGLSLDGRVLHTGSRYANATNTLKVAGFNRIDVGARYLTDIQGQAWTFRARIDNLLDKDHWASVGGSPGSGYLVAGAPRTLGLSASVDF